MATVHMAAESGEFQEIPAARGCTYLVPAGDWRVALSAGGAQASHAARRTARNHLGVDDLEIEDLGEAVLLVLHDGPKSSAEIRAELGERVRNLGEAGRKQGQTTTLPLATGKLQAEGRIRRITKNGRIDTERYLYAIWTDSPLKAGPLEGREAEAALAERYWSWVGVASMAEFRTFSGLAAAAAKAAVAELDLQPVEEDRLVRSADRAALDSFAIPSEPRYAFLGNLDSLLHLRRSTASILSTEDADRVRLQAPELLRTGVLAECDVHVIVDRGQVVGFWDYDPEAQDLVDWFWEPPNAEYRAVRDSHATWVRQELEDFRADSLDSPKSRRPRLQLLRRLRD
jgi:hypothetical protein